MSSSATRPNLTMSAAAPSMSMSTTRAWAPVGTDALSRRARKRIKEAKKKSRPELKTKESWRERGYANGFDLGWERVPDTVERISVNDVTPEEFIARYEEPYVPVAITDAMHHWPAQQKWTLERLAKKYRNQKFKCGEDNEGYSVKLKMKYYVDYMKTTDDDSPLYIFDSSYGDVTHSFKRHRSKRLVYLYRLV